MRPGGSLTAQPHVEAAELLRIEDPGARRVVQELHRWTGRGIVAQTKTGAQVPWRVDPTQRTIELFVGGKWQELLLAQSVQGYHERLPDLMGGKDGEHYHLTLRELTAVRFCMEHGSPAGGSLDHSKLANLAFAVSGHTGFMPVGNPQNDKQVLYATSATTCATSPNLFFDYDENYLGMEIEGAGPAYSPNVIWSTYAFAPSSNRWLYWQQYVAHNTNSWGPYIQQYRARYSGSSFVDILDGDYTGNYRTYGWGDGAWRNNFRILSRADENWGSSQYGTYVDFSVIPTGASAIEVHLRLRDRQLHTQAGSATYPPYSFSLYPTTGMFATANVLAWAETSNRLMSLDSAGRFSIGHDADPGTSYGIDGRWDQNAQVTALLYNPNTGGSAAKCLYVATAGGGDAWHKLRVYQGGNVFWSHGIDADQNQRYTWNIGDGLGDANDRMELLRTGVFWLHPHSNPTLNTDGQLAFNSASHAIEHYMGGIKHYGGHVLYIGPSATDSDTGSGAHAETLFASDVTMPANYLTDGKGLRLRAICQAQGGAAGANIVISFRIRIGGLTGLEVARATYSVQTTLQYYRAHLNSDLVCINPGASGLLTGGGVNLEAYDPSDTGLKLVDASELWFLDPAGESITLSTSKNICVTYQVEGTSGGWTVRLLYFSVERIG